MIPFNLPHRFSMQSLHSNLSGDGEWTKKCNKWFQANFCIKKALLTTSCTHALEMAGILIDIQPGDEVIMPSYTFVSTANAFVLRGAVIVFVDIRPDTMNLDEAKIEAAITDKTKAIVPVHYAGVGCEMDVIMNIAKKHNLLVIEDAAQGVMSTYKGKALGSIGDIGCFSFHETKNYSMGEGGAILINNAKYLERAEIIREKGTNRAQFIKGQVDKYTWVDIGSSYLPSDILAAYLWQQLQVADEINLKRLSLWASYKKNLSPLAEDGHITLPYVPKSCKHNAHMFYIKCKNQEVRDNLIGYLKAHGVMAVFHYVPLHGSPYGRHVSRFHGVDKYTTIDSQRILRLSLYYSLTEEMVVEVCGHLLSFFGY